jgi:L-seryl-tRNA(Ser) seleniumtransferase
MSNKSYKEIPSVQEVLQEIGNEISVHENYILRLVRTEIAMYREQAKLGKLNLSRKIITERIVEEAKLLSQSSIKNVINGTGIVLHTNFGRAPISKKILKDATKKLSGYVNLEVDMESGKRGDRLDHLYNFLGAISNTEGGIIVNNNAAAVLLTLNTLAEEKEVIVSRGQEVEIGGSFRIPDIVKKSNCELVEIGTTNRTHLKDYEKAINKNTALLLWVHTSNYVVKGFTKKLSLRELVELGKRKRIPVFADLGSGAIIDLDKHGLPKEITVQETMKTGVAVATFSGDKLLGGPQSGLIVGENSTLQKIKSNPLYRALRCDKLTISLMDETLRTYTQNDVSKDNLSNQLLQTSQKHLKPKVEKLYNQIKPAIKKKWKIELIESIAEAGSGSLPEEKVKSIALQFVGANSDLQKLAKNLRMREHPIVGYINRGKFYIDFKAVLPDQYLKITKALNEV